MSDRIINATAEEIMAAFGLSRADLPRIRGILEKMAFREAKKTVRIMEGGLDDE